MTRRTYADAAWEQGQARRDAADAALRAAYEAGEVYARPERITAALDAGGHEGPGVDAACGVLEPAVDEWEAGTRRPSWEQLVALGDLTGVTPGFFFRDVEPLPVPMFLCSSTKAATGARCLVIPAGPAREPVVPVDAPTTLF